MYRNGTLPDPRLLMKNDCILKCPSSSLMGVEEDCHPPQVFPNHLTFPTPTFHSPTPYSA